MRGGDDMQEIYDNLFQETISYSDRHMSPRNLYLIRQPGRSLMVDTSFRFERDWEILRGMVDSLGVSYKELDVFITHDHPDHTGLVPALQELGASVYMNPEEMWATWKRTGLPAFKGKPEPEDGVAYFEVLSNGDALVIPRRNSLGTPNTLNIGNFNAAIDALKRDAKYGSDNDRTEGRIWWDVE